MIRLSSMLVPLVMLYSLSGSAALANSGDAIQWLQRMVSAVHSLNYEGTFVFLRDKQLETMQVIHTVDESGEKERLFSLNGVPREVFRDSASVTCISPDIKSISIGNRLSGLGFRAVFAVNISELSNLYDFHVLGEQRVMDRLAKVIAVVPKDNYRYGYRIYLDMDNAFPLKSDMMGLNGEALSQIMFTQLEVNPAIQALQGISIEGKENYAWIQQKNRATKGVAGTEADWQFDELPKGFSISFHGINKVGSNSKDGIDHFVLSDGLASLSVYVEKLTSPSLVGSSNMGTVNAFGRELDGSQITAVGEVPLDTVRRVANAMRYSPKVVRR